MIWKGRQRVSRKAVRRREERDPVIFRKSALAPMSTESGRLESACRPIAGLRLSITKRMLTTSTVNSPGRSICSEGFDVVSKQRRVTLLQRNKIDATF